MGDLKEKFERIPLTLLLVIYLGYVGYDYYSYTSGSGGPVQQRVAELEALRTEVNDLKTKQKQGEEFFNRLEEKKAQVRDLALRLEEKKAVLSEDFDVAAFVKTIFVEAKKSGVNVLKLDPKGSKQFEYYTEEKFLLAFHAVYLQLIVFLDRIASTQRIVRVENFSMKPVSNTNAKFVELEGTIELKAYRYSAAKSDAGGAGGQGKPASAGGIQPMSISRTAHATVTGNPMGVAQ